MLIPILIHILILYQITHGIFKQQWNVFNGKMGPTSIFINSFVIINLQYTKF